MLFFHINNLEIVRYPVQRFEIKKLVPSPTVIYKETFTRHMLCKFP